MTERPSQSNRLSLGTKLGYGPGELSSAIFWVAIAFWLMNYLTDIVGLSAGLAGVAVLAGKGVDAFVDPGVGFLSDRTRSRWGRRRPWFLFGAIPFGLAFVLMFAKPGNWGQGQLFAWCCAAFIVLNITYSCVNVPYNSLLPELSDDYDERSSVTGVKSFFAIAGALLGAGAAMPIIQASGGGAKGFLAMGCVFGVIATLGVAIPFFATREPRQPIVTSADTKTKGLLQANKAVLSNRPFRLILGAWTLNTCGVTVVTATLVYYFKYVMGNAGLVTYASLIMMLAAMACVPLAVKLSSSIGKRTVYMIGMAIVAIACIFIFAVGRQIGILGCFGLMLAAGIGLSAHYAMPWAIVPDAIDFDYAESGIRREGSYYGLWTFMIKIGQALAAALVGLALSYSGYAPAASQGNSALLCIRLLVGPVPALLFGLAIILLNRYPIDRKAHEILQKRIKESSQSR